MPGPIRLLVVEDSVTDAKLLERALRAAGWDVSLTRVETAEEMRQALAQPEFDAVLSDWSMPRFSGAGALALLNGLQLDIPFIIVSGTVGEESAVAAMRAGARDYVVKDRLARLTPVLDRELEEARARRAQKKGQEALRQAEEQLRHAQKLEAIGSLAAGIAHDFNNLLSVVLGTCDLLLLDLNENDPACEGLKDIQAAGIRAAQLTRQFLAFARRQILQPHNVNLDEIVSGVATMLRRLLGENIEIVQQATRGLGCTFLDPGQVEQVILNLAVNARDAMPNGGRLTLATANVVLDEASASGHGGLSAGEYVMLAVTDTGSGMDTATQARIFEPFFTTKPTGKGTGLGLSTVFGVVEQSGGKIWVESALGQGSTFKLYFPRSAAIGDTRQAASPGRIANASGRETILLVEDDDAVRKVVHTILVRTGYTVLVASHGPEALELARRHVGPIALLLTDMVMPFMSGRELADKMQASRPDLRTLYMSGYTGTAMLSGSLSNPAIAFVQKPVTPEVLASKLREVLDAPLEPAVATAVSMSGAPLDA
jgi:two-component system cell cycle sensor histidine kinase/response regulator CckA